MMPLEARAAQPRWFGIPSPALPMQQEQHAQRLLDTVYAGEMTIAKFNEKMEKLRETGYLYEEDYERDTPGLL